MSLFRTFLSVSLTAIVSAYACADLKVVSKVDMSMNGDYHPSQYTTTYYKGPWVRIDSQNKTLITNSITHKTIEIDHIQKTYNIREGDLASDAAETMQLFHAKLTATVNSTDEHQQIQGLNATKYVADIDFDMTIPQMGKKAVHLKVHMDDWTTEDLPVKSEAGSIVGAPNDMIRSLFSLTGVGKAKEELSKIKGFTLTNKITSQLDAPDAPAPFAIEIDYECVSLSQATLNQAMFRIPSDYKKEDLGIDWKPAASGRN